MTATARYEVSTCRHCGEPIVRLRVQGLRRGVKVRWLHTPNRLHCLNVWREVLDTVAQPPARRAPVVALRPGRKPSDVRVQRRWAA
ncbi:hypothetical protein ABZY58_12150 [Micromonospora tulbaghiae]|uniref:hypothetical protein n=1 Tax=Micromonospora tulbaghiae TaxID=479978 RepID=UPI0033AD2D3C